MKSMAFLLILLSLSSMAKADRFGFQKSSGNTSFARDMTARVLNVKPTAANSGLDIAVEINPNGAESLGQSHFYDGSAGKVSYLVYGREQVIFEFESPKTLKASALNFDTGSFSTTIFAKLPN